MGLTMKQHMFAFNYTCVGTETFGNATKSAIKAGYSETSAHDTGCALLKHPDVAQYIDDLMSSFYDNLDAQNQRKYYLLWDMANDDTVSAKDKRGAIDILNKMHGTYNEPSKDIQVNVFNNFTDDELKAIINSQDSSENEVEPGTLEVESVENEVEPT